MKYWIGFLTFAVAVLSLFVINAYCNDLEYSNNNAGVLISALGVLVTFVVAWQIWQMIDAKSSIREFEKKTRDYRSDLQTEVDNLKAILEKEHEEKLKESENLIYCHVNALLYEDIMHNLPLENSMPKPLSKFLKESIGGIKYGLSRGNEVICLCHLQRMYRRISLGKMQKLTESQIATLISELQSLDFINEDNKKYAKMVLDQLINYNKPRKDPFEEEEIDEQPPDPNN